jgi:hypothetical protein
LSNISKYSLSSLKHESVRYETWESRLIRRGEGLCLWARKTMRLGAKISSGWHKNE